MGPIFKSFVAGAAILAATISTASAQDYTWTISYADFGAYAPNDGSVPSGDDDANLVGSFTLVSDGAGGYNMTSFYLETSYGSASNVNGAIYDDPSGATAYTNDGHMASQSFVDWEGNYQLDLFWTGNTLLSAMNGNMNGAVVFLQGLVDMGGGTYAGSVESDYTSNNMLRYLTCEDQQVCEGGGGILTLAISNVPTPTPEPASLLVLGAGLLGLAAARRRKAR